MKYFSGLSPGLLERLALLSEECAEVCKIVGKIIRHGYESCHPDTGECNSDLIEEEIGHVLAAIKLLEKSENIDINVVKGYKKAKLRNVKEYLHHN